MDQYWLITDRYRYHGGGIWHHETMVICDHPIDWLVNIRKICDDREIHLINTLRIDEEQYNKYKDILE